MAIASNYFAHPSLLTILSAKASAEAGFCPVYRFPSLILKTYQKKSVTQEWRLCWYTYPPKVWTAFVLASKGSKFIFKQVGELAVFVTGSYLLLGVGEASETLSTGEDRLSRGVFGESQSTVGRLVGSWEEWRRKQDVRSSVTDRRSYFPSLIELDNGVMRRADAMWCGVTSDASFALASLWTRS